VLPSCRPLLRCRRCCRPPGRPESTPRPSSVSESVAVPPLARWAGPILPWAWSCYFSTPAGR
jgi:hypothetical protein